ncbi:preprotein translocase subunit SecE [Campylobacter curvus]
MVGGSNPSCPAIIRLKMEKLINYIKLSKLEILKVIFPTKEQVRNAFITVFIVVTVVSLFLALVDAIMSFSLSKII